MAARDRSASSTRSREELPPDRLPDRPAVRIEHDSLGDVEVPATARWGAQTQRAVDNFPVSGTTMEPALLRALAIVKAECARVNASRRDVPLVTRRIGDAIAAAAEEVAAGVWADQFPVDVFQTGSGTSTNMNMNEVLASLASERLGEPGAVHPNDHVNASQSSNDVFPTALHLAAVEAVTLELLPGLEALHTSLARQARRQRSVVKAGRTHLMDATPITLGQELGGHATQVRQGIERVVSSLPRVGELPLGGTAVGTGINAPKGFAAKVVARLVERTGLPLSEAPDHVAAQAARDALVELSGQLRATAVALVKIANDLRWMASGPRTGLGEIRLPDLQPGSSIMPGKVNPVIPEAVLQVAGQVIGNDAAVAFAGQQGAFELNIAMPLMARNLLESIRLMGRVTTLLAERCVDGIEADVDRCRRYAEDSPSVATSLNPWLGYDVAAEVVKEAVRTDRSIREVVRERGLLDEADLDRALDVLALTRGGLVR